MDPSLSRHILISSVPRTMHARTKDRLEASRDIYSLLAFARNVHEEEVRCPGMGTTALAPWL